MRAVEAIEADLAAVPDYIRALRTELAAAIAARKAAVLADLARGEKHRIVAERHGVPMGTVGGWAAQERPRYVTMTPEQQARYRKLRTYVGKGAAYQLAVSL